MHTAAIDGTSDWPGEPCETSIPRIIVGTLDTKGIEGVCSITNIEFNPPSWKRIDRMWEVIYSKDIEVISFLLYFFSFYAFIGNGSGFDKFPHYRVSHLCVDLKQNICEVLIVDSSWRNALCNNSIFREILSFPWTWRVQVIINLLNKTKRISI